MKVRALKEVNTVSPEYHWREGEVRDLPDSIARQLLTNPNFEQAGEPVRAPSAPAKVAPGLKKVRGLKR